MSDLIALYDTKKWAELDWTWKHEASPDDCTVLLARMERDVGYTFDENGFSKRKRYKTPWEVPEDLKYPAEVLQLGGLAAACHEEPPMDQAIWEAERSSAQAALEQLLEMPEVTEGKASLSRRDHAKNAIERFKAIEVHTQLAIEELDKDNDVEWFVETVAALKLDAFYAGLNYQAALGKEAEGLAIVGDKLRSRSNLNQNKTKPETIELLEVMMALTYEGKSDSEAARIALKRGHGSSIDANRQAWKRHKRKQKEAEAEKK